MVGIAAIVAALALANPTLSTPVKASYARAIQAAAARERVDPLVLVAIFWHESGVQAGAVSPDGEDYGLGQIRARYVGACRADADPVHNPSSGCRAEKARLLNPEYNIRATARFIGTWRRVCKMETGAQATSRRWLAGYAGASRPSQGIWCGQQKVRGRWLDLAPTPGVRGILKLNRRLHLAQARSGSALRSAGSRSSRPSKHGR